MSVSMSTLTFILYFAQNQSSLCRCSMLEPCEIWEMIHIQLKLQTYRYKNRPFNQLLFPPLLITSYRRFKINLSTWLTNRYFNRAFCLWAKKLAVDSGIMWQKAETCKILKLIHPKISFADKQQFQQAAVLCILPRSKENPPGSQIVNQNFITDKVHPQDLIGPDMN